MTLVCVVTTLCLPPTCTSLHVAMAMQPSVSRARVVRNQVWAMARVRVKKPNAVAQL